MNHMCIRSKRSVTYCLDFHVRLQFLKIGKGLHMGMFEPHILFICIGCEQILSWFTLSAKKPLYKLTLPQLAVIVNI
jgi:hypothetical protein